MIDPKFKDLLTLANMGVTPDALTAFQNHRNKIQQGDDAVKMRNSVLFGNTFANPGSQTNVTFIPPQAGSMYNNMVTPDDINDTRRDMMRTQANLAMTNNPINPMFNRPARPSGSALLNDVNANSAPVIFQNLNREAVADNLEKTIGAVDKRENKLAKRKEISNKLKRFGLALQGKDPNELDAKKLLQQLQIQTQLLNQKNTSSIIQAREDKISQENDIINYAISELANDPNVTNKEIYKNNRGLLLEYGKIKIKEKPSQVLVGYIRGKIMSPNKFKEISDINVIKDMVVNNPNIANLSNDKVQEFFNFVQGISYNDYVNNVNGARDFINRLIRLPKDYITDGEYTSLEIQQRLNSFMNPLNMSLN